MLTLQLLLLGVVGVFAQSGTDVYVHLFEWRWDDVAKECETFLGPKGYKAVQVSPPGEHIVLPSQGYPWWQRYQIVDYYTMISRSGNRTEFQSMVDRCKAVGVDIYADSIIQHMTGAGSGTGSGGTKWDGNALQYSHYSPSDFHSCSGCPSNCDISNYNNKWEVQTCRLVGLRDLNTGDQNYVQPKIASYLDELAKLGVAGLRLDGCKHVDSNELNAILAKRQNKIFVYQEVIYGSGQPITPEEYIKNGRVTEFRYGSSLSNEVRNNGLHWLSNFGQAWGFIPESSAMAFIDNHDNQRGHGGGGTVLTHKDKWLYTIANIFMLSWPYGYPQVMSSYYFTDSEAGPPSDGSGNTLPVTCGSGWACEHRWTEIANMVNFRRIAGTNAVTRWWTDNKSHISFARGNVAFLALSTYSNTASRSYHVGLPSGRYCNVIEGEKSGSSCTGSEIYVDASGYATFSLSGRYVPAVAIHTGSQSFFGSNSTLSE